MASTQESRIQRRHCSAHCDRPFQTFKLSTSRAFSCESITSPAFFMWTSPLLHHQKPVMSFNDTSLSLSSPTPKSELDLLYIPINPCLLFFANLMVRICTSSNLFALSWDHLNSKMINSSSLPTILFFVSLLVLPVVIPARRIDGSSSSSVLDHNKGFDVGTNSGAEVVKQDMYRNGAKGRRPDTVQVAGSSLPDCSHACGSCSPCRLVMVSFVCASLEQAEPCPMAYKCMCNSKSYPVPWPS